MKKDIHPTYHSKAKVTCACGNTFETGSTKEEIKTELCNLCHPFFTGTQKIIDTARRVEKFQKRAGQKAETPVRKKREKKAARRAKQVEKQKEAQKVS